MIKKNVYRSRLVGKEFNNEAMDGIFAGTPPLEALRCLIHEAATVRTKDDQYSKVGHSLKHPLSGKYAWSCLRKILQAQINLQTELVICK